MHDQPSNTVGQLSKKEIKRFYIGKDRFCMNEKDFSARTSIKKLTGFSCYLPETAIYFTPFLDRVISLEKIVDSLPAAKIT